MRFLLLPLLLCPIALGAFDLQDIGQIDAEFSFKPEYNRGMGFCYEFAAAGEAEFKESYTAQGGIALGQTGREFDLDLFLGAVYLLPLSIDLRVHLQYLYNAIPEYTYQTHSIIPYLSYLGKWGGIDLGSTLRFTSFDSDPSIFEPILSARVFVNILNLDRVKLRFGIGNFSTFYAGNLGDYYLFLGNRIDLNANPIQQLGNPQISLIQTLDFHQTGSIGLTSTFQGFAWKGGVLLSW